jgi:predicted peptidase
MMTLTEKLLTFLIATSLAPSMQAQDAITPKSADPHASYEVRVFEAADGAKLPYRLLKPIDFDPQLKYPLVIFLHGAGERGDDNAKQLVHGGRNLADEALRRRHPAFVIFPQCPAEKKWVEVPWDGNEHVMPVEPSASIAQSFELVAALQQEFSIDDERIYGVGLSMGGYGVWDVLQRKPELLAAAVAVCGGGDPAYAAAFKSTPVWAFHGAADPLVIPDRSRTMVKALQAAGGRPIYTEYEGVGHDSWTQTFDNRLVWDWLFAQRKQQKE